MPYIFISKKQCTLRYVFIFKIYVRVLTPKYKRTYDQIDQIEKGTSWAGTSLIHWQRRILNLYTDVFITACARGGNVQKIAHRDE